MDERRRPIRKDDSTANEGGRMIRGGWGHDPIQEMMGLTEDADLDHFDRPQFQQWDTPSGPNEKS